MEKLNFEEQRYLEKILEMEEGYVLDFSNSTFKNYIFDNLKINIYDDKYNINGESKANRLRTFIDIESSYNAGELIEKLMSYWLDQTQVFNKNWDDSDEKLHAKCLAIAERLKQNRQVENIDAIKPNNKDADFQLLSELIKIDINNDKPEVAIDRLHTFLMKYIRELLKKHQIKFLKKDTLNAMFSKYILLLIENNQLKSEMSKRILKSSISILDAYNNVRNELSFAHDNPILNYNESLLIFNNIANLMRFVNEIEDDKSKFNNKLPF